MGKQIEELEAQVKQLAAENAALKSKGRELLNEACKVYENFNEICDDGDFMDGQTLHEFQFALDVETPATDAILASLRAEGVEMFANHQQNKYDNLVSSGKILTDTGFSHYLSGEASTFAAQLRSKSEVQS